MVISVHSLLDVIRIHIMAQSRFVLDRFENDASNIIRGI